MILNSKLFNFIIVKTISNFLILAGLTILLYSSLPLLTRSARATLNRLSNRSNSTSITYGELFSFYEPTTFGTLLSTPPPLKLTPINKEAAIIIEKIGVNTPIVWDVPVVNKKAYQEALNNGVAHAKDSAKPSRETGNTYLFAHSTFSRPNPNSYEAAFTDLYQLQKDDRLTVFYQNNRFDYIIKKKEVVPGFDLTPLQPTVNSPTLTLQTCDPPGILKNRLIVTAELVGVYEEKRENNLAHFPINLR